MTGDRTITGVDALLFDLDGVLVDSRAAIERSMRAWAKLHGLNGDRVLAVSHGRRDADLVRTVAPGLDIDAEVARITALEVDVAGWVTAVPGAAGLLTGLPADRWAVVTSSTPPVALARLAAAGLPEPALLIAADDVDRGKPAPDGYLLAAEKLGVPPGRCLVFEDAAIGAAAARSAGMRCIGVGLAGPGVIGPVPDLTAVVVTHRQPLVVAARVASPQPVPAPGGAGEDRSEVPAS
jgi:sugar-phosphatase